MEDLEPVLRLFDLVLEDYTFEQISLAFKQYLKRGTTNPKPADIVNIIDPPVVWCSRKYDSIMKDMNSPTEFVSEKDREYVKAYLNR